MHFIKKGLQTLFIDQLVRSKATCSFKPVSKLTCLAQKKSCLTETGYQPNFHKVHIVATGAPQLCLLAKKFAKQYILNIILGFTLTLMCVSTVFSLQ